MTKYITLLRWICGMIFLVSAFSKALDTEFFAQTIADYGFSSLTFSAPIIILFEAFIGSALLASYRVKEVCILSVVFLSIISGVYVYALIFHEITDCGCFGHLAILNQSPIITLSKNLVLVLFLIIILRNYETTRNDPTASLIVIISIIATSAFFAGNTSNHIRFPTLSDNNTDITDEMLKPYITTNPDSSYLVFLFSYSCPHCLNSIANLEQYKKSGMVDKIIGIAIADDERKQWFENTFHPEFDIIDVDKKLLKVTHSFPVALFLKNGSIQLEMRGTLPHPAVLESSLHDKSSMI